MSKIANETQQYGEVWYHGILRRELEDRSLYDIFHVRLVVRAFEVDSGAGSGDIFRPSLRALGIDRISGRHGFACLESPLRNQPKRQAVASETKRESTHVCIVPSIVKELRCEAKVSAHLLQVSDVPSFLAFERGEHISGVDDIETFERDQVGQDIRNVGDRCVYFTKSPSRYV